MANKPSEDQINEQYDRALDQTAKGGSQWPGMSYEQGVANTIAWLMGDDDTLPMED